MPERKSFRAYSAILYLDPRMKIYIQVTAVAVIATEFFSFMEEESVLKRLVNLFTGGESAHKTIRRQLIQAQVRLARLLVKVHHVCL